MKKQERILKKYKQAARREARKMVASDVSVWERALKPRPHRMPKFIWNYIRGLVVDVAFLKKAKYGKKSE